MTPFNCPLVLSVSRGLLGIFPFPLFRSIRNSEVSRSQGSRDYHFHSSIPWTVLTLWVCALAFSLRSEHFSLIKQPRSSNQWQDNVKPLLGGLESLLPPLTAVCLLGAYIILYYFIFLSAIIRVWRRTQNEEQIQFPTRVRWHLVTNSTRERRPRVAPERLYLAPQLWIQAHYHLSRLLYPFSRVFPFRRYSVVRLEKGALEWIFVLQGLISALQKLYNYRVTVASKPTNTDTTQTQINNSDLWGKEDGFKERKAEEQLIRQKPAVESELSQRIWMKFMPCNLSIMKTDTMWDELNNVFMYLL